MQFDPGFAIETKTNPLDFVYGADAFGPAPEHRMLKDIRRSLADPNCSGPEEVYCIAMDVGALADRERIRAMNLLYGAVVYEKGLVGDEPVRSQGHIHAVSPSCGSSTCEVYEIWEGKACIYMQQRATDDPGRCWAVYAEPGDVVIVPPSWVHATVNAGVNSALSFGAWCVRDYGFEYADVIAHGGIAFFPKVRDGAIVWDKNPAYCADTLECVSARPMTAFGLQPGKPIYTQFQEDPARFRFVAQPGDYTKLWASFSP